MTNSREGAKTSGMSVEALIARIHAAFANVEPPPPWCIVTSREGDEPALLEREFTGKTDWRTLPSNFIDRAPDGFGSALSFFSDEAYRFFMPAYLVAHLRDELQQADPIFHLASGFGNNGDRLVNPRRYGARTSRDYSIWRNSMFDAAQSACIAEVLQRELDNRAADPFRALPAAIEFWRARAA